MPKYLSVKNLKICNMFFKDSKRIRKDWKSYVTRTMKSREGWERIWEGTEGFGKIQKGEEG